MCQSGSVRRGTGPPQIIRLKRLAHTENALTFYTDVLHNSAYTAEEENCGKYSFYMMNFVGRISSSNMSECSVKRGNRCTQCIINFPLC